MPVTHAFQSAKADGSDATLVRASNWNASHVVLDGITAVSSTYAVLTTDELLERTAGATGYTVTLPTAVGVAGKAYMFKRIDAGVGVVTIATTSSQTIDGQTTLPARKPVAIRLGRVGRRAVAHQGSELMLKRTMLLLFGLLCFAAAARGQGGVGTKVRSGSALPTPCIPASPNGFVDTFNMGNFTYTCLVPYGWSAMPVADVTLFGARQRAGGTPTMTATCTASSYTLTSVSGDGFGSTNRGGFAVGDGIFLWGCGPTETMSTPSGVTVTPSITYAETATRSPVASAAGSTTYTYVVIAADAAGGHTAPSSSASTTTGLSSLGLQTATISSISRSNDTITVNTSASTNLVVGALIDINIPNNKQFTGWYNVSNVVSGTQFQVYSTNIDTRAQGFVQGDTTSYSGTGGTVAWYQENFIKWPSVTGAFQYYVCGKRPGDANSHLIGTTMPSGQANGFLDNMFEDYGSPYMDKQTYPPYIETSTEYAYNSANPSSQSDAICTGSALNDPLSTYVTAHNAGTGNWTIHDAPTNTVSATSGVWDDAPGIRKAAATIYALGGGSIYFPPTLYSYLLMAPLTIPANVNILQSGGISLYGTLTMNGSNDWWGDLGSGGTPQFGVGSGAPVGIIAVPGIYLQGAGHEFRGLNLNCYGNINGCVDMVSDNASPVQVSYTNFITGGPNAADYLGMAFVLRDSSGTIADVHFDHSSLNGGPDQVLDKSWTPLFWVNPNESGGIMGSVITMDKMYWGRRGIAWGGGYGLNNGNSAGPGGFTANWMYRQGGITPIFQCTYCNAYAPLFFQDITQDTEGEPLVASCGGSANGYGVSVIAVNATGGTTNNLFGCWRPAYAEDWLNLANASQFPNRDSMFKARGSAAAVVAPYAAASPSWTVNTRQSMWGFGMPIHGYGGYSWWFDGTPPATVTCPTASGGSIPAGTWYYAVSAVGADYGETILSMPCGPATTSTGTQTANVGWSNVSNAFSYNVWRCNTSCVNPDGTSNSTGTAWYRVALHVVGLAFSDTLASPTQYVPGVLSGSGPTVMNNLGVYTPVAQGGEIETGGNAQVYGSAETQLSAPCETNGAATTLSGASTTTGLTCLPANAVIDAVTYRVTTTITTATSFTLGDSGSATRYGTCTFSGGAQSLTAGATGVCNAGFYQIGNTALGVKITPNANPGAGALRLFVYYHTWIPPQN